MNPLFSILISTKRRTKELDLTLNKLQEVLHNENYELLIVVDGCKDTEEFSKANWKSVYWFYLKKSVGASAARNFLYKKAKGKYLIGLDDDAHFISKTPFKFVEEIFKNNPDAGIIAFQEFRGIHIDPNLQENPIYRKANDFIGCGFCIRKDVYDLTSGFPVWMDIYGEEHCVATEVLSLGYDIIYTNTISVHHRVNKSDRENANHNIFRFKKALLNTNKYYIVYYPIHMLPKYLLKLFLHNFIKYGLMSFIYFVAFMQVYIKFIIQLPFLLKHRNPVTKEMIRYKEALTPIPY